MRFFSVEFLLVFQMVMESILGGLIIYYLLDQRKKEKELREERERVNTLIGSLQRILARSSDLDKSHQRLLELWEKVETRGAHLETCIGEYARGLESFTEGTHAESGIDSYKKVSLLIEKGFPAKEIAQTVGLSQGEVELIMNLKKQ